MTNVFSRPHLLTSNDFWLLIMHVLLTKWEPAWICGWRWWQWQVYVLLDSDRRLQHRAVWEHVPSSPRQQRSGRHQSSCSSAYSLQSCDVSYSATLQSSLTTETTLCFNKKQPIWFFVITSSNENRFSKFFQWHCQRNCLCIYDRDFHPTLTMLLHYLEKFENSKQPPNYNLYQTD